MKISLIIPCFNEQETVEKFYNAAKPVLRSLTDMEHEMIFVDDGSRDKTGEILLKLAKEDKTVKVVRFSRNFGQQAAMICGFEKCGGDCAVELDCDLQDPVEMIPVMVEKWKQGYEVVHGRRVKRKGETPFKKISAYLFYKKLNKITSFQIPRNTGVFKLIDRKIIDIIVSLPEKNKYLPGLESWVGFKQTFVEYEREARVGGKGHYNAAKLMRIAKSGVVANTDYPLTLSLKAGATFGVLSVLGFISLITLAVFNVPFDAALWALPTITATGSAVMLCNGITNMYVDKIHEQTQDRPEYIIEKEINF